MELYEALPYRGEIEPLAAHVARGSSVLELGCGAGRLTRELLSWGCSVTAVDHSGEMLSCAPPAATTVQSAIEKLRLDRSFDVVLLASCLINHPEPKTRDAFLSTAAQHLAPGGVLYLERHDVDWLAGAKAADTSQRGDFRVTTDFVKREQGLVHMQLTYHLGERRWSHRFTVEPLSREAIENAMEQAGFGAFLWLDTRQRWVKAVRS